MDVQKDAQLLLQLLFLFGKVKRSVESRRSTKRQPEIDRKASILAQLWEKMDEALYSATYVDNYIDSVENLPDDVQRHLSRIRDIDVQYRSKYFDGGHS